MVEKRLNLDDLKKADKLVRELEVFEASLASYQDKDNLGRFSLMFGSQFIALPDKQKPELRDLAVKLVQARMDDIRKDLEKMGIDPTARKKAPTKKDK